MLQTWEICSRSWAQTNIPAFRYDHLGIEREGWDEKVYLERFYWQVSERYGFTSKYRYIMQMQWCNDSLWLDDSGSDVEWPIYSRRRNLPEITRSRVGLYLMNAIWLPCSFSTTWIGTLSPRALKMWIVWVSLHATARQLIGSPLWRVLVKADKISICFLKFYQSGQKSAITCTRNTNDC